MRFVKMLLVFTALLTLAFSYPTGLKQENTATHALNGTYTTHDVAEDTKPTKITVKDKNPKAEAVVVEFIYKSNSGNLIFESKDKDRYSVVSSLNKNQTQNLTERHEEKLSPIITYSEAQKQIKEPQIDQSHRRNEFYVKTQAALIPEEILEISEKWPKYYYRIFNPVHPFPEIHHDNRNEIFTQKVKGETVQSYLTSNEKEKKYINVSGPPLTPLSIYDREFRIPVFD
jgi:hypothetical protein